MPTTAEAGVRVRGGPCDGQAVWPVYGRGGGYAGEIWVCLPVLPVVGTGVPGPWYGYAWVGTGYVWTGGVGVGLC